MRLLSVRMVCLLACALLSAANRPSMGPSLGPRQVAQTPDQAWMFQFMQRMLPVLLQEAQLQGLQADTQVPTAAPWQQSVPLQQAAFQDGQSQTAHLHGNGQSSAAPQPQQSSQQQDSGRDTGGMPAAPWSGGSANTTGGDDGGQGVFIYRGRGERTALTASLRNSRWERARYRNKERRSKDAAEWLCNRCCSTNWQQQDTCRSCGLRMPESLPVVPGQDIIWQEWRSWSDTIEVIAGYNEARPGRKSRPSGAQQAWQPNDAQQPWQASEDPQAAGSQQRPPHLPGPDPAVASPSAATQAAAHAVAAPSSAVSAQAAVGAQTVPMPAVQGMDMPAMTATMNAVPLPMPPPIVPAYIDQSMLGVPLPSAQPKPTPGRQHQRAGRSRSNRRQVHFHVHLDRSSDEEA